MLGRAMNFCVTPPFERLQINLCVSTNHIITNNHCQVLNNSSIHINPYSSFALSIEEKSRKRGAGETEIKTKYIHTYMQTCKMLNGNFICIYVVAQPLYQQTEKQKYLRKYTFYDLLKRPSAYMKLSVLILQKNIYFLFTLQLLSMIFIFFSFVPVFVLHSSYS